MNFEQLHNENESEEIPIETEVEQAEQELATETGITKTVLEKIRNNTALRRAFNVLTLSVGLFMGSKTMAQEQPEVETKAGLELQDERTERHKALLQPGEYAVPNNVMQAYALAVDPNSIMEAAGGYFSKDYMDTAQEQAVFGAEMNRLGYSEAQADSFKTMFTGNNIVFSENTLAKEDFKDILGHERLHRSIDNLEADKQVVLNSARDEIINEYKNQETQWSAETDALWSELQAKGEVDQTEYNERSREIIERYNPILMDSEGQVGGSAIMAILRNSKEFYTYLMMDKLDPRVESHLSAKFPEAHKIYSDLKNGIYEQLDKQ